MKAFIEYLAEYLFSRVKEVLTSTAGGQVRVILQGLPLNILEQLFTHLLRTGEVLLTNNGQDFHMPIYLVAPTGIDPEGLSSGRCSGDHLVKIRNNSECKCFVMLLTSGESLNQSITSSAFFIGIDRNSDHEDTQWAHHPLVSNMIGYTLGQLSLDSDASSTNVRLIEKAISDASALDVSLGEDKNKWEVLRSIFDIVPEMGDPQVALTVTLGFPHCEKKQYGSQEHINMPRKIAEFLEVNGITNGFGEWISASRTEIQEALRDAQDHILGRCDNPSEFTKAPSYFYKPKFEIEGRIEIPSWWRILTLDEWNDLLSSQPEETIDGVNVTCTNYKLEGEKGLPFVFQAFPRFEISPLAGLPLPATVTVFRSTRGKKFDEVDSVELSSPDTPWCDKKPPIHERPLRYRFIVKDRKPVTLPAVVLDNYQPRIFLYSRSASKQTLFKKATKRDPVTRKKIDKYVCDMNLIGVGTHHLDIFYGQDVRLSSEIVGYETNSEHGDHERRPINESGDYQSACLIESDEECWYEFTASYFDNPIPAIYRIYFQSSEMAPVGATSEFDRLIIEHRAASKKEPGQARVEPVNCRSADLQMWMLQDSESYKPLLLSDDYLKAWKKPEWGNRPILSIIEPQLDPRPEIGEMEAPPEFVAVRKKLQEILRGHSTVTERLIESVALGDQVQDQEFRDMLSLYLGQYLRWLQDDYQVASWADLLIVTSRDATGTTLNPFPHAILLSPLHPVRIGWQCVAQGLLKDAIDKYMPCPAASVLEPGMAPDCFLLPCRTASGRTENKLFLSVSSSSDYWGVMWNSENLDELNRGTRPSIFDSNFGITVDGLSSGFSVRQVERAIDEVAHISSSHSTLRLSIESDTEGVSSCNEGVESWCVKTLGESDPWKTAGPRKLEVYDDRSEQLHPEEAHIANMTRHTGATLRWFQGKNYGHKTDLAIIAHLGSLNPSLDTQRIFSAIDVFGLNRFRIRKQLPATQSRFIAESRIGHYIQDSISASALPASIYGPSWFLNKVMGFIEGRCAEHFDCYIFAPRIPTLEAALNGSRYCAVSSTSIDPSCFFNAGNDSYLWDYDLPSYSRRSGENNGFYLLAAASPSMVQAIRNALSILNPGGANTSEDTIRCILGEISHRGIPTLKRLTAGGAASLGEVGMLVALRVLQHDFSLGKKWPCLVPVIGESQYINLVVPVDPFRAYFDELRSVDPQATFERPDLLVISIRIEDGQPAALKITPIEIKARTQFMDPASISAALEQATSFTRFLGFLIKRSEEHALWGIAVRHLFGTWIDYAFRVYGQLEEIIHSADWSRRHADILQAILSGDLIPEIDTSGRLIIIDASPSSVPRDLDGDGLNEILVISHQDAFSILTEPISSVLPAIHNFLKDWNLQARIKPKTTDSKLFHVTTEVSPSTIPLKIIDTPIKSDDVKRVEKEKEKAHKTIVPIQELPVQVTTEQGDGVRFSVGKTIDAFQSKPCYYYPSNTDLNQLNVGIVGDLGTGKTQLIQALIYQLVSSSVSNRGHSPNVLIFDYKKDYLKKDFVEATKAKIINPNFIPLNIFDTRDCEPGVHPWLQRAKFFNDIMLKIFNQNRPVQQELLKQAIKSSYESVAAFSKREPTIYDVFQNYKDVVGASIDSTYSIMSDMVSMELFAKESSGIMSFSEFFKGVVVINLGALGQDDNTKNMLVAILLNLFYEYMLNIEKKPIVGNAPQLRMVESLLLVDEADNIMKYEFEVLRKILLQGREFGVGVLLASQYLSHFKRAGHDYREPLLTWFIHKVPNISIKELEAIGLTRVDRGIVDRIKTLKKHQCLYKTLDVDGEIIVSTPFYELYKAPV